MARRPGALVLFGASLAIAVGGAASLAAEAAPYRLQEVAPSVVVAVHDVGSNLVCVALDEGLVFFDAGLGTRAAEHFRRAMEARFERPTRALVLTHAHLDHILGMAAFDDVEVWAAASGRPRWEHFTGLEWDEATVAGYATVFPTLPDELVDAELRMPSRWFDDELVLGGEDDRVLVRRTGGHTVDSSAAVAAHDTVIIAGDLVQARRRPYFGEPDTDFGAWIGALRSWEDLQGAAVCPGHGPVIETTELAPMRRWFEQTEAVVTRLKGEGLSVEAVVASDAMPGGYWPTDDPVPRWWTLCIRRLYDAV